MTRAEELAEAILQDREKGMLVTVRGDGAAELARSLLAYRADAEALAQRVSDHERVIEKRGKEIDRQAARAVKAEADAEALAEALKGLLHYAGGEIPAHHVAKAELALTCYRGEK